VHPSELLSIKQRYGIIGNSPLLNHAIQVAVQVAPTEMTVLITGESGVGKESFSKIIHSQSLRKHGQFIAINCGAIPEGTIDSELFGHEKGAFTGATDARKGYFEVTNKGTIFLDEIGEMPLGTQARLLRVLENGEFIRVGSSKVQKTDVRVVAATNVNLLDAVQKGKFREDLYYRLNTVPIFVPPLRERGDDIELLFRKFASDFAERYRVKPIKLNDDARQLLLKYRWPGNIRQLKNIAEQISILELEREIDAATLARYLPPEHKSYLPAALKEIGGGADNGISERELLYKVLFDMKKDLTELKKFVFEAIKGGAFSGESLRKYPELFAEVANETASTPTETIIKGSSPFIINNVEEDDDNYEDEKILDITHETEVETLSLDLVEKEMILKALKRNNNKRKYAARDLGISERTLYRKLKQYEIDA
jgi:transcriptional regulator with PAS, ATPase and Fis domain